MTLNVVPGLGAKYLYQHRWRAALDHVGTSHLVRLEQATEAVEGLQNQIIGLSGLVALAARTTDEAGLAAKKAREAT